MKAVIEAGGKQYIVAKNQILNIELIGTEAKTVEFEPLLVIDGDKTDVGSPLVKGAKVKAEVLGEEKGDKITVLKYKRRKRIRTKSGHRQSYTKIKITSITN